MKSLLRWAALAASFIALPFVGHAIPQLRISDGITTVTISDGGTGDQSVSAGVVGWTGTIGVWTISLGNALTKPALGYYDWPHLLLNLATRSSGAGTLTVSFTEIDFNTSIPFPRGRPHGYAWLNIYGETGGTVLYSGYGGTTNIPFDTSRLLGTVGPLGPGPFADSLETGQHVHGGFFGLTQTVTITHDGAGTTNVTALLRVPESGATIVIFAAGLAGLMFFRRRLAA